MAGSLSAVVAAGGGDGSVAVVGTVLEVDSAVVVVVVERVTGVDSAAVVGMVQVVDSVVVLE